MRAPPEGRTPPGRRSGSGAGSGDVRRGGRPPGRGTVAGPGTLPLWNVPDPTAPRLSPAPGGVRAEARGSGTRAGARAEWRSGRRAAATPACGAPAGGGASRSAGRGGAYPSGTGGVRVQEPSEEARPPDRAERRQRRGARQRPPDGGLVPANGLGEVRAGHGAAPQDLLAGEKEKGVEPAAGARSTVKEPGGSPDGGRGRRALRRGGGYRVSRVRPPWITAFGRRRARVFAAGGAQCSRPARPSASNARRSSSWNTASIFIGP